jgi:hypothetical protein
MEFSILCCGVWVVGRSGVLSSVSGGVFTRRR